MTDQAIVQGLIARDPQFTRQFFYQNCLPLLYKLISEVFSTHVDYDEMVNELYIYLMAHDAQRLRSYSGNSSIYQWMKTVARRFFIDLKLHGRVIEDESKEPPYGKDEETTDSSKQEARMDVAALLDQLSNERYRFVLRKVVLEGMDYDELAKITGLMKSNLYNIKKRALAELERIARLATTSDGAMCAIMCEEFILHVFGIHKTLEELRILASSQGWLKSDGVEVMDLGAIPEYFGMTVAKRAPADLEDVEKALNRGYQVIVAVDGGELAGDPVEELAEDVLAGGVADHCVVVLSMDRESDTVVIFDPAIGVIPLSVSVDHFADAWADSDNYMVTIKRKNMEKKTYTPHPVDLGDIELTPQLEQLREAIAENAHEVWAAGRIREGWTYGPERDDKLKKHPDLIPYSELPEGEKQYDRETAMNTIKLVMKLGYSIEKKTLSE
jgi:RNA polymerase sigma factor (sigma-70 family)